VLHFPYGTQNPSSSYHHTDVLLDNTNVIFLFEVFHPDTTISDKVSIFKLKQSQNKFNIYKLMYFTFL